MLTIEPTGAILGATIQGLNASKPIPQREFGQVLRALGRYGVLRFPDQQLDEAACVRSPSCLATFKVHPPAR